MGVNEHNIPLHVQVSNYIRERIYDREWNVGNRIPTEFELCDELGMSRGSIKRGIKTLVDEGVLVQQRGRGTFVVQREPITHPSGGNLLSFAESLRSQGIEFQTRVLEKRVVEADAFLASKLRVLAGSPVLLLKRVRSVDSEPIMYIENRIELSACPGLEHMDFNQETLFQSMERRSGKRVGFSRARYAAKVAGAHCADVLDVDETAPVLHLEQHVFYEDNTPAEWGNVWLRANRYVIGTVLLRA